MPFDQLFPRSFTASSVRTYAPPASGVYGISNATEWIYIGETENIREALLGHVLEFDASRPGTRPAGFVFEVCDRSQRPGRQQRLVLEYRPVRNSLGPRPR